MIALNTFETMKQIRSYEEIIEVNVRAISDIIAELSALSGMPGYPYSFKGGKKVSKNCSINNIINRVCKMHTLSFLYKEYSIMIKEDKEFIPQYDKTNKEENIEVLYLWNMGGIEIKGYNLNDKIVEVYFIYDGCQFLIRSKKLPTYNERFLDVIKALIEGNYSSDVSFCY